MQQASDVPDPQKDVKRLQELIERAARVGRNATRNSTKRLAAAALVRWRNELKQIIGT